MALAADPWLERHLAALALTTGRRMLEADGAGPERLESLRSAIEWLGRGLAVAPDNDVLLYNAGFSAARLGRDWDEYQAAYQDALSKCSTKDAPWFVIPSNNKWFRNVAVSQFIVDTLKDMDLRYPRGTPADVPPEIAKATPSRTPDVADETGSSGWVWIVVLAAGCGIAYLAWRRRHPTSGGSSSMSRPPGNALESAGAMLR